MIGIRVIVVGKLKEIFWKEACAEYVKRLKGFCRLEVIEVSEERMPDQPSDAEIRSAIRAEGRRLLSKAGSGSYRIALCIEGPSLSSVELCACLSDLAVRGQGSIDFFIGGSWGLSEEVKQNAQQKLSMSPMTFPHQLARVMLLEQIYRAMQIAAGGKYHK